MPSIKLEMNPTLPQIKGWIDSVQHGVLGNLKDFWEGWARKLVVEEIARIFATQGYGTWASLSERYAYYKSKKYPGRTILRAKDIYFRASTRKGASGNIYEIDKDSMTWGADGSYFANALGYDYPTALEVGTKKMPARPVYDLAKHSEALQRNLVNGLSDFLHKRIEAEARKVFR